MEGQENIIGRNLCGPACLRKILEDFGQYCTLEELATLCGTTEAGTNAAQIIAAAAEKGITATAHARTFTSLEQTQFPAIAHWEGGHFVVITELDKSRRFACIYDPAAPRNTVIHSTQLLAKYSNVVIEFEA